MKISEGGREGGGGPFERMDHAELADAHIFLFRLLSQHLA